MTVKINASVLGIKKPIEVKESNKNVRATLKAQIKINKVSVLDDNATDVDFFQSRLDILDIEQNFVTEMLNLDEKTAKKIDDIEPVELDDLAGEIVQKIQHIDMSKETEEVEDKDPKAEKSE